jgi:hypothetical protein
MNVWETEIVSNQMGSVSVIKVLLEMIVVLDNVLTNAVDKDIVIIRRVNVIVSLDSLEEIVLLLNVRMIVIKEDNVLMAFVNADQSTLDLVVNIKLVLIIVTIRASVMMKANVFVFQDILVLIVLNSKSVLLLKDVFKNVLINV